ncbi:hypothetical protein NLJ89_g7592 [Agrocybe chaxingu]|uniref:ER membrane protein complex subunit 7 beta-sandwich domain-containing protein n=1 Tax=Agrocybe chaxingu TaxID=84603 RepID=A0A9W8JWW4_9AGAR|nr:hypothetical protein NLJ89_g7592 [Agrocybe chaxingu]
MARIALLLQLLSWAVLSCALDLTGRVAWNNICSNATSLGQAEAYLNEGAFGGRVTRDGKFVIPDVPQGTYILSISSHDYSFEQLRVDVARSSLPPEVRPYIAGTPLNPPSSVLLPYPIVLSPKEKNVYFVPPESFNLTGMLANPMMLLMVGAAVMVFAMPYLMKNLDPEALEEFKEQQSKVNGIQSAFQTGDFKSGFSALMAGGESPTPQAPAKAPQPAGAAKGRSSKKARR